MATVKLSEKHQIVVPKEVRKQLGLKPGQELLVTYDRDGAYVMPKPHDWGTYMRGLGKEMWENLGGAEKYIARERDAWEE